MNPVKNSYDDGVCPDCDTPIPDDAVDGTECEECGHVFYEEKPCKREQLSDGWWCINDHTGCIYNDGHNECMHKGNSTTPLEEKVNG